jgi:hypothetical protein
MLVVFLFFFELYYHCTPFLSDLGAPSDSPGKLNHSVHSPGDINSTEDERSNAKQTCEKNVSSVINLQAAESSSSLGKKR